MIADEDSWSRLPGDVCEWLHAQKARSAIPPFDDMLVEMARVAEEYNLPPDSVRVVFWFDN